MPYEPIFLPPKGQARAATPLERHANAEKFLSEHLRLWGRTCPRDDSCNSVRARNRAFGEYTGNPHPSTIGRG